MIAVQTDSSVVHYAVPLIFGFWTAAIPLIASGINALGGIFSKGAKGSQDARLSQDMANANIFGHATQGAAAQGMYDLKRNELEQAMQAKRMNDAVRAGLFSNLQDFSMGGPGAWKATGGLRPSVIQADPASMEAARMYQAKQLERLSKGEQFKDIKWPEVPQASKAGWLEKVMGGLGLGGSILGGLGEAGMLPKFLGGTDPMKSAAPPTAFQPDPSIFSNIKFG